MAKLQYTTVGSVLTVTNPETDRSFSYDTAKLRDYPKLVDKILVHTVKKLLQERTSDCKTPTTRWNGMQDVVADFEAGQFKATPKSRRKLPDWLKGRRKEIDAIAALKGITTDVAIANLERIGEEAAAKVFDSEPVQDKMAEAAEGFDIDFTDLIGDDSDDSE